LSSDSSSSSKFSVSNESDFNESANSRSSSSANDLLQVKVKNDSSEPLAMKMMSSTWDKVRTIVSISFFVIIGYAIYQSFSSRSSILDELKESSKSLHKEATPGDVSFADVCGVDEAKSELAHLVQYLRDPTAFVEMGAHLPNGVLLVGPPGTGKTLLARALASEANVPFLHCSGADFDEIFVGSGSRRVRQLFAEAKEKAPCIVFIDELDTVGRARSAMMGSNNATLNKLLAELDGFEKNSGVVLIGATNFAESLDKALMRPGRFDRVVHVDLPDLTGRRAILDLYLGRVNCAEDEPIDVGMLARATIGFSGAELENLVNLASIKAVIDGAAGVTMTHLHQAYDDALLGLAKTSRVVTEKDKRLTAYHESGHALLAYYTRGAMPIRKLTVVPRGNAAGYLSQVPDGESSHITREALLARIAVAMGGRAAEELIYGELGSTAGASSDIQAATKVARAMVEQLGMSDKVGRMFIDEKGPSDPKLVHAEVARILEEQYEYAAGVLRAHERELHRIAEALIERETLLGSEIKLLLTGKKLPPFDPTSRLI
jgi:ATP-dependent metalloprotease